MTHMGASKTTVGFEYRPRIADGELTARLAATGAVLIGGPRCCGKTETARKAAASEVRLDVDDEARTAGLLAPSLLLDGDRPRLIDEWQADAIVERRDGAWAAFEVKLGQGAVERAAEMLLRVAARVNPEKHGRPALLAVITGWGYACRRPDGVAVIPIGSLPP